MGLRVSTTLMYESATRRTMDNLERLYEAQQDLATGKRLRSPGDNPPLFTRLLSTKSMQRELGQFQRNIASGQGYLSEAESSLESVVNLLIRAKELAMQGASGGTDQNGLAGIAIEVQNLFDQTLSMANASWSGGSGAGTRYLFAGFKSDAPAFDQNGTYQGDGGEYRQEISPGEWVSIGFSGARIFQGDADVFAVLAGLKQALDAGDEEGIRASLDGLDQSLAQMNQAIAEVGARVNRLEQTETRLEDTLLWLQSFVSGEEDVDLTQAASRFTLYQSALDASIRSTQLIFETLHIL
ncbi:MAG: flagellar hook-associated protein FlgL [bacterium]